MNQWNKTRRHWLFKESGHVNSLRHSFHSNFFFQRSKTVKAFPLSSVECYLNVIFKAVSTINISCIFEPCLIYFERVTLCGSTTFKVHIEKWNSVKRSYMQQCFLYQVNKSQYVGFTIKLLYTVQQGLLKFWLNPYIKWFSDVKNETSHMEKSKTHDDFVPLHSSYV